MKKNDLTPIWTPKLAALWVYVCVLPYIWLNDNNNNYTVFIFIINNYTVLHLCWQHEQHLFLFYVWQNVAFSGCGRALQHFSLQSSCNDKQWIMWRTNINVRTNWGYATALRQQHSSMKPVHSTLSKCIKWICFSNRYRRSYVSLKLMCICILNTSLLACK